jgi:hypothetical protein
MFSTCANPKLQAPKTKGASSVRKNDQPMNNQGIVNRMNNIPITIGNVSILQIFLIPSTADEMNGGVIIPSVGHFLQ